MDGTKFRPKCQWKARERIALELSIAFSRRRQDSVLPNPETAIPRKEGINLMKQCGVAADFLADEDV